MTRQNVYDSKLISTSFAFYNKVVSEASETDLSKQECVVHCLEEPSYVYHMALDIYGNCTCIIDCWISPDSSSEVQFYLITPIMKGRFYSNLGMITTYNSEKK